MSDTIQSYQRYERQLILPEIGVSGQRRLGESSVLIVGMGGLGNPVSQYLAAAGVGHLGILDKDVVSVSNLHRQVLYTEADIGELKVEKAATRLRSLNPDLRIDVLPYHFTSESGQAVLRDFDLVVDCTDTFQARYAINDACILAGIPVVFASITQFDGQATVWGGNDGPCYRCLFPEPPPVGAVPSCAEGGVLGVLPGLLGMVQATEALKLLLGIGTPLIGRLLLVDALGMSFRELTVERDPECPVCAGSDRKPRLVSPAQNPSDSASIDVKALSQWLSQPEPPLLLDVRTAVEKAQGGLQGLHIPVAELPDRLDELAAYKTVPLVVVCRSGVRSEVAIELLQQHGFTGALNLTGGLLEWKRQIDPSIDCA